MHTTRILDTKDRLLLAHHLVSFRSTSADINFRTSPYLYRASSSVKSMYTHANLSVLNIVIISCIKRINLSSYFVRDVGIHVCSHTSFILLLKTHERVLTKRRWIFIERIRMKRRKRRRKRKISRRFSTIFSFS